MTGEAARWLIVCGCAGNPEELVGAVDLNTAGEATVWSTGRSGGAPSLKAAHRMIRNAPAGERRELLRKLQTREVRLRVTVTFLHPPCGKSLRVNEDSLGELLGLVSKVVPEQRVSLELLCSVNGIFQRGATR